MDSGDPLLTRRRSPATIRHALLAAAKAEFGRAGYAGATTSAIARHAGTTEARLFRYFASKRALFRAAILDPLNHELIAFTDRAADAAKVDEAEANERQAARYIEGLTRFIKDHERTFVSLFTTEVYRVGDVEGIDSLDALHAYFEREAAIMSARTGSDAKITRELMVRVSFATVLACTIFRRWLFPEELTDEQAVQEAIGRFVIDGLYASAQEG
jgi:AcrR family transcriptional regulator